MSTLKPLRNKRLVYAVVNGQSWREASRYFKVSMATCRGIFNACLQTWAPEFVGLPIERVRARREEIYPLIERMPEDSGQVKSRIGKAPGNTVTPDEVGEAVHLALKEKPEEEKTLDEKVVDLMGRTGMDKGKARRLIEKTLPISEYREKLENAELLKMTERAIQRGFNYLDDEAFAKANLQHISYTLDILNKQRSLLRGEPTQILTHTERAKLEELLPALLQEMQRRGITIDGVKTTYSES